MKTQPPLREATAADLEMILALYPAAFPDEDLTSLVAALAAREDVLSLGAFEEGAAVAHGLFTLCGTGDEATAGALLGPLAVAPGRQGRGLGSALVREGLDRLAADGRRQVFVLGDPAYYARFDFAPEGRITPPCPIPEAWAEAWRSLTLPGCAPLAAGPLATPPPWRDPALWTA